MERNLTQLIKENNWLLPVLEDLVKQICSSSAEMDDPNDLAQVHLQDFIKANSPTPLLSKLIEEKSYDDERNNESVISLNELNWLLKLVAKGEVINDIEPPQKKNAKKQ